MTVLILRRSSPSTAIQFVESAEDDHDYVRQNTIPDGFGDAACRLKFKVKLNQSATWTQVDAEPYSDAEWWFDTDFLLDGHNNTDYYAGTYSFGFFDNGRPRWMIGNGASANARLGDLHGLQGPDSLLDGQEHTIELITEFVGSDTVYTLRVDGVDVDTETAVGAQVNMASTYWDGGFPSFTVNQRFWCWGTEKQAAIGLIQYFDYKGTVRDIEFYGASDNLIGDFPCDEGSGTTLTDDVGALTMSAVNPDATFWTTV